MKSVVGRLESFWLAFPYGPSISKDYGVQFEIRRPPKRISPGISNVKKHTQKSERVLSCANLAHVIMTSDKVQIGRTLESNMN